MSGGNGANGSVLRLEGVRKTFGHDAGAVGVLDGASLELAAGDFLAVRGPSGCGKTTLLLAAGGLLAPDAGRVLLDETDLYALGPDARAARRGARLGFVFQQFFLVPYLDVRENVLAPSLAPGAGRGREADRRADELLERLGLAPRARHLPSELSAGEKQRAALARALLRRPAAVLADEPTGNLDPENARAVLDCLTDCAGDGGAVLLVTHDPDAAARAGRTLELAGGRIAGAAAANGNSAASPPPGPATDRSPS